MTSGQMEYVANPRLLQATVIKLVASTLNKKTKEIQPDESLFSTKSGFDSFSLMEFVLQLEETFDISIPDDDLDPDIFYSIESIIDYLNTRLEVGGK